VIVIIKVEKSKQINCHTEPDLWEKLPVKYKGYLQLILDKIPPGLIIGEISTRANHDCQEPWPRIITRY
jgi:hypothetical protein